MRQNRATPRREEIGLDDFLESLSRVGINEVTLYRIEAKWESPSDSFWSCRAVHRTVRAADLQGRRILVEKPIKRALVS